MIHDCQPREVYTEHWDQMDRLLRLPGKAYRHTVDGEFFIPDDSLPLAGAHGPMTGLDPDTDLIIEIATVVTDKHLVVLAEGPVMAIHQSDAVLDGMDEWNKRQHGESGLTERVKESAIDEQQAQAHGGSDRGGTSILTDRPPPRGVNAR